MAKDHDLPVGTGAFRIANGQIIGPTRKPFVVQGPALLDGMMASVSAADILSKFPKANSVNLACGADGNGYATAQPLSDIFAWVDDATSKGLSSSCPTMCRERLASERAMTSLHPSIG